MKSHELLFSLRDLARAIVPTILVAVGLAGLVKTCDRLNWLPAAELDPPLAHQFRASRTRNPAQVILVGDSTCLVGVDAPGLSRQLPGHPGVLNLSLYIGIDLAAYGEVLSDFTAANPGQVRTVVLLLTSGKLAGLFRYEDQIALWRQIRRTPQQTGPRTGSESWSDRLGLKPLRQRVLDRWLPAPLHGSGADFFGFSSEIDPYMTAHGGSMVDFGAYRAPRWKNPPAELTLSPQLETESRAFRGSLPPGAKLFIGLTPSPESLVSPDEDRRRADLLRAWNAWIDADRLLTNLPSALPDALFSKTAHLNERGRERFTVLLGRALADAGQGLK